jgi:signal transduction histidine kinase
MSYAKRGTVAGSAKAAKPDKKTDWQLRERVKELTALHKAARILRQTDNSSDDTIRRILTVIPPAWQYPEITGAKVSYQGREYATENFRRTRWMQRASFGVKPSGRGSIEICYLEKRPRMDEGPFLTEERALIRTLAEMLRFHFQRCRYEASMGKVNRRLGMMVASRTSELLRSNEALKKEIDVRKERDRQLRALASQLTLAEENERRQISVNLHDHIGQALAMVRRQLHDLQGNSVLSGAEKEIEAIQDLTEQIIRYTRSLTVELSPPVLYELGLGPALSSLADQFNKKRHLPVCIEKLDLPGDIDNDVRIIVYSAVRELLNNIVKHAFASKASIRVENKNGMISITVVDNGKGCPALPVVCDGTGFGLFSIRERLRHYGGTLSVGGTSGTGTSVFMEIPAHKQKASDEENITGR